MQVSFFYQSYHAQRIALNHPAGQQASITGSLPVHRWIMPWPHSPFFPQASHQQPQYNTEAATCDLAPTEPTM